MSNDSSFFSMDRLVEFGMGMAVAQQMVGTMNHTMQNMRVPGAGNPVLPSQRPELAYYVMLDGKQAGPFSECEVVRLINDKKVSKETYVWHAGLREWQIAENVPTVLRLVALAPPPPPTGV